MTKPGMFPSVRACVETMIGAWCKGDDMDKPKKIPCYVYMSEDLRDWIDEQAKKDNRSRSRWVELELLKMKHGITK